MKMSSKFSLGHDVLRAISEAKNEFKTGNQLHKLKTHEGTELWNIVWPRQGGQLLEFQVGNAHQGDPRSKGSRRLVLLIEADRIENIFFSEDHYLAESWHQIVDW
jgi:hypothetical protein